MGVSPRLGRALLLAAVILTAGAGAAFATGHVSASGTSGTAGTKGDKGDSGSAGGTGAAGSVGATGAAGPPGAKGADGALGPQGPPGASGPVGAQGPQGPAGPSSLIAFGMVNFGTLQSSSGNVGSVTWQAFCSCYEIDLTAVSYYYLTYTTVVTPIEFGGVVSATTGSIGGHLQVYLLDNTGTKVQGEFSFAVFKH